MYLNGMVFEASNEFSRRKLEKNVFVSNGTVYLFLFSKV